MARWFVSIPVYAAVFGFVEANTADEARELVEQDIHGSLCCQCSDWLEIGEVDLTEDPIVERCDGDGD